MKKDRTPATIDNEIGHLPLWGILNVQGDFWTARTFNNREDAGHYIYGFWGGNKEMRDKCLRSHRIVPVRVEITEIVPAQGIEARQGGDRETGRHPKDESPVGVADAPITDDVSPEGNSHE